MEKQQIVIVGVDITPSIMAQVKELYPDHEITVVSDAEGMSQALAAFRKQKALDNSEPMRITREDLIFPEPLRIQDVKFHNPWLEPHHSSKKRRKY